MSGNWFDWLNSMPGGAQQQQPNAQDYMKQQAALAQTQQTGYLPPEQWQQQQMAPQTSGYMQQLGQPLQGQQQAMNPAMQQMPGVAGSANMSQDQMSAMLNALRQLGGGGQAPSLMGQLTQGLGQQRLPDFSGGGPSYSPYAMPGTVRYNPNG